MASEVLMLDVLIASPGDATRARDLIERALHSWNDHRGHKENVILRPRRWEIATVLMLDGREGQSIVNSQIVDDADIVIAVFYYKFGTPTVSAASGTAEEIERSILRGKPVHLYFGEMMIPHDVDIDQLTALRAFKRKMYSKGLVGSFAVEGDLWHQVMNAIESDLPRLKARFRPKPEPIKISTIKDERSAPASKATLAKTTLAQTIEEQGPVPPRISETRDGHKKVKLHGEPHNDAIEKSMRITRGFGAWSTRVVYAKNLRGTPLTNVSVWIVDNEFDEIVVCRSASISPHTAQHWDSPIKLPLQPGSIHLRVNWVESGKDKRGRIVI